MAAAITAASLWNLGVLWAQTPHFSSAHSGKSTGLGVRTTGVESCYQLVTEDKQIPPLWIQFSNNKMRELGYQPACFSSYIPVI